MRTRGWSWSHNFVQPRRGGGAFIPAHAPPPLRGWMPYRSVSWPPGSHPLTRGFILHRSPALRLFRRRHGEAAVERDRFAEVAVCHVVVVLQLRIVPLAAEIHIHRLEAVEGGSAPGHMHGIERDPAILAGVRLDSNVLGGIPSLNFVGQEAFPDAGGDVLGTAKGSEKIAVFGAVAPTVLQGPQRATVGVIEPGIANLAVNERHDVLKRFNFVRARDRLGCLLNFRSIL